MIQTASSSSANTQRRSGLASVAILARVLVSAISCPNQSRNLVVVKMKTKHGHFFFFFSFLVINNYNYKG